MSLTNSLERLAAPDEYAGDGKPKSRWGEVIRSSDEISRELGRLSASEKLLQLSKLGRIRGGVVTRANAYFLVRELAFDQIPARMRVTRADLRRIAVVVDGVDHVSKIEREFLRPVIKGPESLETALAIKRSDLRLFDVKDSKKTLEKRHANGALAYLRRGETQAFKTSDDDLKGGIPAKRSQVKNRKPFWYSLQGEQLARARIVFPEHIDRRYVFTFVDHNDESVVIDKLYLFEPAHPTTVRFVHASLNTLLTWYQVELRGRSQLGQGVLELKIPDYAGLLVANPDHLTAPERKSLLEHFAQLSNAGGQSSLTELGTAARHDFDIRYLELCGVAKPEKMLLKLERELRALAGERIERRLSVADAKVSRRKITNVAASIDAYASRIAASIEPHPDPRTFVPEQSDTEAVTIFGDVEGTLEVGAELFNQGEVLAGGLCVARAGSVLAAQFVRGVLLIQPDLTSVDVPRRDALEKCITDWSRESRRWHKRFQTAANKALVGLDDPRTKAAIEQRALRLLHAV